MNVRFFTYSQFHNKIPPVGSTHIRVHQLLKYWPEARLYTYGENADVMIFQKVYMAPDYQFIKHFEGIKILDICDPDWLGGMSVKETCDAVDAVTVPTKELQRFMKQLTDKPVVIIPDRWDFDEFPKKPKLHTKPAKTVVWYGYSHNAEVIRPALPLLNELDLNLIVVSNDDPLLHRFANSIPPEKYTFIKHKEGLEFYEDIRKADFALLPKGDRPEDRFKSDNKTTRAILAGLPVATDRDSVTRFMEPNERTKYIQEEQPRIRKDYDVRKSVEQYKILIEELMQSSGKAAGDGGSR